MDFETGYSRWGDVKFFGGFILFVVENSKPSKALASRVFLGITWTPKHKTCTKNLIMELFSPMILY